MGRQACSPIGGLAHGPRQHQCPKSLTIHPRDTSLPAPREGVQLFPEQWGRRSGAGEIGLKLGRSYQAEEVLAWPGTIQEQGLTQSKPGPAGRRPQAPCSVTTAQSRDTRSQRLVRALGTEGGGSR